MNLLATVLLCYSMKVCLLCHVFVKRAQRARVSESQTESSNIYDLYQKLVAFQKRDGHTYIHT